MKHELTFDDLLNVLDEIQRDFNKIAGRYAVVKIVFDHDEQDHEYVLDVEYHVRRPDGREFRIVSDEESRSYLVCESESTNVDDAPVVDEINEAFRWIDHRP